MRLLDRYLAREYSLSFLYCFLGFVALVLLADLFDKFSRLIQANLTSPLILRYYGSFLAANLDTILPATILMATLYTLWTMTRHGELIAMRASGVSLGRIMLPFLVAGVLASVVSAVVKETIAPEAGAWAKELARNKFRLPGEQVYLQLHYYEPTARRLWQIGLLRPGKPIRVEDITITQERADGTSAVRWRAARGEWLDGEWWFFDVRRQDYTEAGNPISGPKLIPGSEAGIGFPTFSEIPSDFLSEVMPWDQLSARAMIRYLRTHPGLSSRTRAQRLTDVHQRVAMPWACLVVTLFGIPVGTRSARQGVLVGILMTVACFFAFYGVQQAGIFLAKRQDLPPWLGGWLSHIVFLGAAAGLFPRLR